MNGTANDSERRGGGKRGGGGRVLFVVQPPFSQIGDRPTAGIKTYKFRKREETGSVGRTGLGKKHLNLFEFSWTGDIRKVFFYIVFSEVFFPARTTLGLTEQVTTQSVDKWPMCELGASGGRREWGEGIFLGWCSNTFRPEKREKRGRNERNEAKLETRKNLHVSCDFFPVCRF